MPRPILNKRQWASLLLGIVLLVIAFLVFSVPGIKPDALGAVGLLIFVAIFVAGWRRGWSRPTLWMLLLGVVVAACIPFIVISQGFGNLDMMAFLFHIDFGIAGGGIGELKNEIITAIIAALWLLFATWVISDVLGRTRVPYIAVALALIATNPLVLYFAFSTVGPQKATNLPLRIVQAPAWNGKTPEADVLFVYLEGFEQGMMTQEFAPHTKVLKGLQEQALSIRGVRQITATGWSMAGIVATQCGLPLVPNGLRSRNNFHGLDAFLGNHRCLGDVMSDAGFTLEFVVGGRTKFAGQGRFLQDHSFDKVMGVRHFVETYGKDFVNKARIDWVLDDQIVFREAKARHANLLKSDRPFGLFVQTITTHGNITYVSRECQPDGIARLSKNVLADTGCFSDQFFRFVQDIRAAQGDRPLRIVVMSDHLNHSKVLKAKWPLEARENLVWLIDPNGTAQPDLRREASMVDIYPTLLEWLDLTATTPPVRGGLGISLFSNDKTLVEEKGLSALNEEIYVNPSLSKAIWGNPSP